MPETLRVLGRGRSCLVSCGGEVDGEDGEDGEDGRGVVVRED